MTEFDADVAVTEPFHCKDRMDEGLESERMVSNVVSGEISERGLEGENCIVKKEVELCVGGNSDLGFEQVQELGTDNMVPDVESVVESAPVCMHFVDALDRDFYSAGVMGSEKERSFPEEAPESKIKAGEEVSQMENVLEMDISTRLEGGSSAAETVDSSGDKGVHDIVHSKAESLYQGGEAIETMTDGENMGGALPVEAPDSEDKADVEVLERVPEMNISTTLETVGSFGDKGAHDIVHSKGESLYQGGEAIQTMTDGENLGGALPVEAPDSEVKADLEVLEKVPEMNISTTLETMNGDLEGSSLTAKPFDNAGDQDAIVGPQEESLDQGVGVIEEKNMVTNNKNDGENLECVGEVPPGEEVAAADDVASDEVQELDRKTAPCYANEETINANENNASVMDNNEVDTVGDIPVTTNEKKSSVSLEEDENIEPVAEVSHEDGRLVKADSIFQKDCGADLEEAMAMEVEGVSNDEDKEAKANFCEKSLVESGDLVVDKINESSFVDKTQVVVIEEEELPLPEVNDEATVDSTKENSTSETSSEVNVDRCLHKDKEQLNTVVVVDADAEHVGGNGQSNISVPDPQEILQVPEDKASRERVYVSEKAEELKIETPGETSVEDVGHQTGELNNATESISPSMGPKEHESENLEAHLVREDQLTVTHLSDTVNSKEVVFAEETVESYEAVEHNPQEMVLNKCTHGSLVVDFTICQDKDKESVKEEVRLEDVDSHMMTDAELSEYFDGSGNANGDLCLETEVKERCTVEEQDVEMSEQIPEAKLESDDVDVSKGQITRPKAQVDLANHLLPEKNEAEFSAPDLVWGKVKNHPWWPGQIFDPEHASDMAMQHQKKDSCLVAYFGDQTFAWNEASVLKSFWSNFSYIEKQSSSEVVQSAISSALDEVHRRIMLGLACSCIPNDIYGKIECQLVENTGIRLGSSMIYGVDESTGVNFFKPNKLLEFLKAVAVSPSARTDRLGLVIAKAQLLAFNQMRGRFSLAEFQYSEGLLENYDTDKTVSDQENECTPNDSCNNKKLESKNRSSRKRKHNLTDGSFSSKRERRLSELMGDGDSVEQDKRISFYAAKVSTTVNPIAKVSSTVNPTPKLSFKVGDCMRRAASQLTGSLSILRNGGEKPEHVDVTVDTQAADDSQTSPVENASVDEMLLQLKMLVRDTQKRHSFRNGITKFFCGFRDSIHLYQFRGRQSSSGKPGGGRKRKVSHSFIGTPEEFEFDDVSDSYWTDMIIQNHPEEQPSAGPKRGRYELVTLDAGKSHKSSQKGNSRKRFSMDKQHEMAQDEPMSYIEQRRQANLPIELILNFSEADVPSEIHLNKTFRRFGPLKEAETEIDLEGNRAKVVFKRCSDAEVAFNSAGKFSIFGPVYVTYELNYSPSISFNTFPLAALEGPEDVA